MESFRKVIKGWLGKVLLGFVFYPLALVGYCKDILVVVQKIAKTGKWC